MAELILNRRRLLGLGAAGASSLVLAGCDQFDFLGQRDNEVRNFLERANELTYAAQRALVPEQALAREFSATEIRQGQRPNGSTDPTDIAEYAELVNTNFAGYRLNITGMVETPKSFTLDELRNMPARSQITRHDCVEGWSAIGQWTGVPLGQILDRVGLLPDARYIVFHCADEIMGWRYYESIDLAHAYHAQTILAYGMNGGALPEGHGAPIRLRVERQLGYKQAKFVMAIEAVSDLAAIGEGRGGFWEDASEYEWYAGI